MGGGKTVKITFGDMVIWWEKYKIIFPEDHLRVSHCEEEEERLVIWWGNFLYSPPFGEYGGETFYDSDAM